MLGVFDMLINVLNMSMVQYPTVSSYVTEEYPS